MGEQLLYWPQGGTARLVRLRGLWERAEGRQALIAFEGQDMVPVPTTDLYPTTGLLAGLQAPRCHLSAQVGRA